MKIYELLKKENINKKYQDSKGDVWIIEKIGLVGNIGLILANDGGMRTRIEQLLYLDEIFELEFNELHI